MSVECRSPSLSFGSGSGRIRIIWPDPDPLQKTWIRIRVAKKIVINSHKNQPNYNNIFF